jgi:hypothetical protein
MFDILFDRGIDALGSLVDAATVLGVLAKRGSWYYLGDMRLGQVRGRVGRGGGLAGVAAAALCRERTPCTLGWNSTEPKWT